MPFEIVRHIFYYFFRLFATDFCARPASDKLPLPSLYLSILFYDTCNMKAKYVFGTSKQHNNTPSKAARQKKKLIKLN